MFVCEKCEGVGYHKPGCPDYPMTTTPPPEGTTEPPVECVAVDRDERCLCPGGPASHRPSSPAPAAEDDAVLNRKPVRNHPDVESPAPNVATSEGGDKAAATSGEQPGPLKAGVMALTGLSSDEVDALGGVREDDRPAPAVPDSTGLRERLWEAIVKVRDAAPRLPDDADTDDIVDAVLAVVGQGVTAEQAWDEGFADGKRRALEGDDGPRFVNPYRAVVRSGEQGGEE